MSSQPRPSWLDGPLGQRLLAREAGEVERVLAKMFGLHCLQVGSWGAPDQFLQYAQTRSQSLLGETARPGIAAVSRASRLSIASDSVDVLLLPHTLELTSEPHQVLREADRVLLGEGHLVVIGFNPWSTWGLRHMLSRKRFPADGLRMIPEKRIRDWLSLLGMEIRDSVHCVHLPPVNHEATQRHMSGLESRARKYWPHFSGVYVVVAQKRVYSAL
ncbi:MAG: class I SAM-dependent methyltransferase, partial [Gammaproteobacteria bacterium]|nr:class I SAM-dependent methyltransferase [Gammaproteobacteria bacterium]